MCTIYGVLLHQTVIKSGYWQFTVFCQEFVVAIYAVLCGEKFSQKMCLWRKMDKYHVCKWMGLDWIGMVSGWGEV